MLAGLFFFLHAAVKMEGQDEYRNKQTDKDTSKLLLDSKGLLPNL
jgi:hypothetical protein